MQHAETSLQVGESGELGVAALKEKRKYSHDKTLLKNKTKPTNNRKPTQTNKNTTKTQKNKKSATILSPEDGTAIR